MRDIAEKIDNNGDTLPAGDFNAMQSELENIVTSADLTLDDSEGPDTDLNMLGKGVANYCSSATFYEESGTANAYELNSLGNFTPVAEYHNNMIVKFKAGNSNTGGSTININNIGLKNLTDSNGDVLRSGIVFANQVYFAKFNETNDRFELINHNRSTQGIGSIRLSTFKPHGHLLCDGASYSRTLYHELYAVIGTTFGTEDSSSFNVPNLDALGNVNRYIKYIESTNDKLDFISAEITVSQQPRIIKAFNGYIFAADQTSTGRISKIDSISNEEIVYIDIGIGILDIEFDGTNIWVSNYTSTKVTVVDFNLSSIITSVTVESNPYSVHYNSGYMYVTNYGSQSISKIDITTYSVSTLSLNYANPYGICSDDTYLYVSHASGHVTRILLSTFAIDTELLISYILRRCEITDTTLYIIGNAYLHKVDLDTFTLSETLTITGTDCYALSISNNSIYLPDTINEELLTIDLKGLFITNKKQINLPLYGLDTDDDNLWLPILGTSNNKILKINI